MTELERPAMGDVQLRAESDGRTLDICLVPWEEIADTPEGPETFLRGAFADTDATGVTVESMRHGGELVGRGTAIHERSDAAYLEARISQTRAGDELLTLVRDGVVRRASIAFVERKGGTRKRRDGVTERTRVDLRRVAVLERGAYPGAGVLAIREETGMPQAEETGTAGAHSHAIGAADAQGDSPPPGPEAQRVDLTPIHDRMERIESRIGGIAAMSGISAPLQYRAHTLGELLFAAWDEPALKRALADQITTDNAGLIPPALLAEVKGIIDRGRRTIDAFGARALPSTGMTVTWPKLSTAMTGLVAAQSAEKAAVVSAKVSFAQGTSAIVTYAGASDVSYQLIRRSDPPYLEQYARVMLTAWSNVTNAAFSAAVYAGSGAASAWAATTDTDGSKFIAALVDASVKCELATGVPAGFVILAPDLFAKVATFYAPKSVNPQSVAGTALAANLVINVSGVPVINESALAASTGYVSNNLAAAWLEDPVGAPAQIAVDDAEKLGQNIAYWSLGSAPLFAPLGIVKFTIT